ncbi:MAG: PHP domain-containing protein [Phycisphaeraceae bacterium]
MRVDLHTHSTASDGTDAPGDLPRLAKQAGLDGFALTDHDTTAGLADAAAASKTLGVRFVPGIELSAHADPFANDDAIQQTDAPSPPPAGSLHLLGYHVRADCPALQQLEQRLRDARATRNPQIIEKLQAIGVRITEDDVREAAQAGASNAADRAIGRPHIAQVLVQRGYVKSIHEAFARYLGPGGAAYTPRQLPTAAQCIDAIHAAGGAVVLAHPVHLGLGPADLEHAVAKLADLGLDGLETQHPDHEVGDTRRLTNLADRFGLITTGGSDYHGSRKAIGLGSVVGPDEAMSRLEKAAAQYAPS